jgi:2-polyprenyl-3-methyl-5-hydroxy-6-metoxy-1,4-benzoquinol methylase/glycosyltransferase involved in cell wall biosynthesis
MFKLRFGFFTSGLPFDGSPIENQSIGGSESALYYMARELARRGHSTQVFCNCPNPGVYDGVEYFDANGDAWRQAAAIREWDVFVAHRFYDVLPQVRRAKSKWLWMHDMPVNVPDLCAKLYDTDQMVVLSEFHEKAYVEQEPMLANIAWRSKNGVDLALAERETAGAKHEKNVFVYASRPERGLGRLLTEIWPRLVEADPTRELLVSSYDMKGWNFPEGLRAHYEQINALIEQMPSVHSLGNLGKADFYRMLGKARAVLYPTSFPEISPLHGDTLVETLGGQVPIRDLVGRKDFEVYSCSPSGDLSISKVRGVFLTRRDTKMVTLRLRPGIGRNARKEKTLTLTPDHEVMLVDGSYRPAGDLQPGDRVKAFWRQKNAWQKGYDMIGATGREVVPEHRFVAYFSTGRTPEDGDVVHHLDGDTRNNRSDNLEITTHREHRREHWAALAPDERAERAASRAADLHRFHDGLSSEEMSEIKRKAAMTRWYGRAGEQMSNHVVVDIEDAPNADAFCMEVEPDHNFVANGIFVHNCITAIEAMACGTPIITTDGFALSETVPYAASTCEVSPEDSSYAERFIAQVERVTGNDLLWKDLQKRGRAWVRDHYRWSTIAEHWEKRAYEVFEERVKGRTERVFDQLVYESDLVLAKTFAEKQVASTRAVVDGYDPQLEWASKVQWLDTVLTTHHEEPDAYSVGAGEQVNQGWAENGRFAHIASMVPEGSRSVLDVGCGAGGLLAHLRAKRADLELSGADFSSVLIRRAQEFHEDTFGDRATKFIAGDAVTLGAGSSDVVISSEVMEHQVELEPFISSLEKLCRKDGTIILSVPSGPWEAISFGRPIAETKNDWDKHRYHVHHFYERDLAELFGEKENLRISYRTGGWSQRGEQLGWFFVSYRNTGKPTGKIDYARKWLTTRPYQKLAYCMIVKNAREDIRKNIFSILPVVDEIHITDTGSTDGTQDVIRALQAEERYAPKIFLYEPTWDEVRPPKNVTNGVIQGEAQQDAYIEANRLIAFDRARNVSVQPALERGADWILWADSDETFQGAMHLRKYLHTKIANACIIRQNHLMLDQRQNPGTDMPFRLFRAGVGLQFFGVVHEQPAYDVNTPPDPAHLLNEVDILHYGYVDQQVVREKMVARNLTLVMKDRCVYPNRLLGKLNVMRDEIHLAQFELEKTGGKMTEKAAHFLRSAAEIYRESFADPKNYYYRHAFKFYERALALLAMGGQAAVSGAVPFEVQLGLSLAVGGIPDDAQFPPPQRRWFASRDELEEYLDGETSRIFAKLGSAYARSTHDHS